jgi:hypothetical protein
VTTGNHQSGIRITSLQAINLLPRFSIGLAGDRTGVKHDDIGLSTIGRDLMALLQKFTCPCFQLCLVEPTSQRLEVNVQILPLEIEMIWSKLVADIINNQVENTA